MRFISHRGNLTGKNVEFENSPEYVVDAIRKGFDVEIDLRKHLGKTYLGHNEPQYQVDDEWLQMYSSSLWIHCKDFESLDHSVNMGYHCFFHNIDAYTITSRSFVWAYPGSQIASRLCISVLPERAEGLVGLLTKNYYGTCSDFIAEMEKNYVEAS
ncbi:hypothetical protein UFOVP658_184 [uncultured Caudovirales phage]|uniref:Uncharacterized protein n=1 Tax=uncultured Caudovirales phage TaxID=2100421 RepID=A0A6J5NAQ4_9CAUD|nr:hypothetical protein UFOVP658_184 [uncultured Caudovirales phage]